jgi:mycothione reductase
VSTKFPLKHVANEEARTVQHNLLHPSALKATDHRFVPHAVFSEPQIAAVGMTEREAKERGIDFRTGRADYGDTAYGWAMEDTGHFVKVIADASTGLLVGAHLVGPQASSLIQPLVQAMSFGQAPMDVARGQYWIHPAMAEVVENALLDLGESQQRGH